jgi:predicted outer membrane repeat protein
VTPTLPPNPDCPDGLPCHTLKHYFSNSSFTEQTANLSMIFLTGQHEGVCKQTELKLLSFSASGVDQKVATNCTTIVFSNAVTTFFENLTLDHCMWYYTVPPRLSYLILEMSSVILQNQTRVYIEHASNISGNRVKLVNTVFKNYSSISGTLSFINNEGAMFLANSTLNIDKNTSITFVKNRIHPSIYLNYSTLNIESNVYITFIKNLRCALMMKFSSLNIMKNTNISFISNSNASDEGIAINIERSIMDTEGDFFFINNSGEREIVCIQTSIFSIRNNAVLQFVNNSAKAQAGGMIVYDTTVNVEDNANMIFTNNTASKVGAMGLLLSTLYVRNNASITFMKNSATTESGALEAFFFSNIHFEDNAHGIFVQNSVETAAGAMALWSSTLNMKHNANITFIDNSATINGGAMVVARTDGLLITGLHLSNNATIIFINNSASRVGGALFVYSSRFILANGASVTIKFIGNSAKSGGAIVLLSSSLELVGGNSNMTFENNSAKENGGAILVQPDLLYYTVPYLHLVDTHCFYKINSTTDHDSELFFYFTNNSAEIRVRQ